MSAPGDADSGSREPRKYSSSPFEPWTPRTPKSGAGRPKQSRWLSPVILLGSIAGVLINRNSDIAYWQVLLFSGTCIVVAFVGFYTQRWWQQRQR